MLLNNQWITGEIKDFNKIPWRQKHNDQNVCYKAHKALPLKEFIVISAYLKKQEKSEALHPKGTRKRTNPKLEGKEIINSELK